MIFFIFVPSSKTSAEY